MPVGHDFLRDKGGIPFGSGADPEHQVDALELTLEELEGSATEDQLAAEMAAAKTTKVASFTRKRPSIRSDFQADAYGGYGRLYEPGRAPGPILEAAC